MDMFCQLHRDRVRRFGHRVKVAHRHRSGFTLVELLVVITIIGILVGLLLPAVNMAREAGRKAACTNNVHQLALALNNFQAAHGFFPSAGWGWQWTGDPDRPNGREQPGGWMYCLLPYIDQDTLWKMGSDGLPATLSAANSQPMKDSLDAQKISVGLYVCPSRRKVQAYPCSIYTASAKFVNANAIPAAPPFTTSRSDYKINGGDAPGVWGGGPTSLTDAIAGKGFATPWDGTGKPKFSGICGYRTEVRIDDILDGASTTYMVGEKYMDPTHYADGLYQSDAYSILVGGDIGTMAFSGESADKSLPPSQDQPATPPDAPASSADANYSNYYRWGSAHSGGFNMAMADGSVRAINYSIDPYIHLALGSRNDGNLNKNPANTSKLPIDMSAF